MLNSHSGAVALNQYIYEMKIAGGRFEYSALLQPAFGHAEHPTWSVIKLLMINGMGDSRKQIVKHKDRESLVV